MLNIVNIEIDGEPPTPEELNNVIAQAIKLSIVGDGFRQDFCEVSMRLVQPTDDAAEADVNVVCQKDNS